MILKCVLFVCTTLICSIDVSAKGWRGVIPLHSTRKDVEQTFGEPKNKARFVSSYEFDDEFVDIYFASGPPCGTGLTNEWRVPRDVVVSVRVRPKHDTNFREVITDILKYQRTTDRMVKGLTYYFNEEEGIRYTVREEARSSLQEISSIDYLPERNQYDRKCSSSGKTTPRHGLVPFERYGNISTVRKEALLDNFAVQLKNERELTGLIFIYSGSTQRASRTTKQVRRHLINLRGIGRDRLIFRTFKHNSDLIVELYLVRSDENRERIKDGS